MCLFDRALATSVAPVPASLATVPTALAGLCCRALPIAEHEFDEYAVELYMAMKARSLDSSTKKEEVLCPNEDVFWCPLPEVFLISRMVPAGTTLKDRAGG